MGSAGQYDLLADSGVYAPLSVDQMLAGKQYIHAVRGFTLVYEALTHVYLQSFLEWLADRHLSNHIPESLGTQLTETYQAVLMENVSPVTALKHLEDELQDHYFPMWREFSEWVCKESPTSTFKFWKMLLDALELLLQNVWAFREGNCKLHIQTQCVQWSHTTLLQGKRIMHAQHQYMP